MTHYSKALNQMKGYDDAIASVKAAITLLEGASGELNAISGVESCDELKKDIANKIEELEEKISTITTKKKSILSTADGIDRREAAERRRKEEERRRELERQKMKDV